jgi:CRISPR-associated endonuclease/helicase Cas3
LFTLTAPTGCGKTFASMAFALGHAETHGLRRVIYALPFTSVTEQNAAEFRRAFGMFGEAAVLEHHSAYAPTETDEEHPTEIRRRLLAENWDAPVVVTTNVRLLETLFASRPSDARRLHRVARSVVVLDEAQAIPVHLLKPTLAALQELIDCYDVSVVLASATMPAITSRPGFPIGLRDAREIVLDPDALDVAMRRTRVHRVGSLDDDALVERMTAADVPRASRRLRNTNQVPPRHGRGLPCREHPGD